MPTDDAQPHPAPRSHSGLGVPARAAAAIFLILAISLCGLGLWLDNWWPFAGAVVSAAVGGIALTEPPGAAP